MNYAVLTDKEGTILSIISYKNDEELVRKTREQINKNVLVEEIEDIPADAIGLESTIPVFEKGEKEIPEDEFYLTPCKIV